MTTHAPLWLRLESLLNMHTRPGPTLYDYAHARTGDKGDRANISVIVYDAHHYDWLVDELTVERVRHHFAHRQPTQVRRYLLPKLCAMNIVLDGVLDGGVNDSLNLDMHGKALAFHLLALPVQPPADAARSLQASCGTP
jgi:hypothetical protein